MKLGIKYAGLRMFEEAISLAIDMDSSTLLGMIRTIAVKQRNIMVQTLLDHHEDKAKPNSGNTPLLKSLV
jgi:uridine phosphorylase